MSTTATLEPPPAASTLTPEPPDPSWVTLEQWLAMPDDGVERDLIDGRLVEYSPMSRRSHSHSQITGQLAYLLIAWSRQQPEPRGRVLVGDAAFALGHDPDIGVGADLAYVSPAQQATATPHTFALEGAPVLAVEIYSPSDEHERVMTKVQRYLEAGSALVWLVDPFLHTVTVYRPDALPELFNESQTLTAEPHLPGFRVPVAEIFA